MVGKLLDSGVIPDSELAKNECKKFAEIYIDSRKILFDTSTKRGEYINAFSTTPLKIAATTGDTNLTQLLLEHGANINKISGSLQRTPLIVSILNDNTDIASVLLENGTDVNIADSEGRTALHCSIYKKNNVITDALIPLINNIDFEDNNGYTPLAFAFSTNNANENIPVILKLLVSGADINKVTDINNSPKVKELVSEVLILFNEIIYPDISAYLPAKVGYMWEYIGNNGEITDIVQCEQTVDEGALFYTYNTLLGTRTGDLYIFESNTVQEIVSINAFGRQQSYRPALTILTDPGKQWQEEDRGDIFQCQTRKTSVSFDGKTYDECIMVEKAIFIDNNRPLMTKRQYFARNIGLVYVTLQGADDTVEKPFLRLSSYNF
jgi:hypothetical protein